LEFHYVFVVCQCGPRCPQWCPRCHEPCSTCSQLCSPKRIRLFAANYVCVVPYGVMRTSTPSLVPRTTLPQIRVPRELDRHGLARVHDNLVMHVLPAKRKLMRLSLAEVVRNRLRARINEILQQLATLNLDFDSQESVFYRVETLYNTVVSVGWDAVLLCCG